MTIGEYLGATGGTSAAAYNDGWMTYRNSTTSGDWDWAYGTYYGARSWTDGKLSNIWTIKTDPEDEPDACKEINKYLSEFKTNDD